VQFTGWATFDASRAEVWAELADPVRLAPCLPVQVPIVARGDGQWRIDDRIGSGWMSTSIEVDLTLSDVEPDRRLRILVHAAASGTVIDGWIGHTFRDGPPEGPTTVDWEIDLTLKGGYAGIVSQLIESRGAAALDQVVACLKARVAR
jgi:carbon monoxide dehydrogenase subunit G